MSIQDILFEIDSTVPRIEKGVLTAQEAEKFFADKVRNAKEIFGEGTDEWRLLDRWENENGYMWHPVHRAGTYAGDKLKDKITNLKKKIEEIIDDTVMVVTPDNEYSFSAEKKYEAYRLLVSIFKGSKNCVWIIDAHLDDIVFDFIDVIDEGISIKLITGNSQTNDCKSIFKRLYSAIKEKNNVNIEAKINTESHARYFVIDDKVVYSTDASINTIGEKERRKRGSGTFSLHQKQGRPKKYHAPFLPY